MLRRRPSRNDGGFTLVELLVAIAILSIITLPIGNLMITYFTTTSQTTARISESHDIQSASAYFAQDVSSLGTRSTTPDPVTGNYALKQSVNSASYPCTYTGATPLISFVWDAPDQSNPAVGGIKQIRVAYATRTANSETQLVRLECDTSSTANTITVILHNYVSSDAPVCSGGGVTGCSDTSGNVPTLVSLTIRILNHDDNGTPVSVTLTGQRRQT